MIQPILHFTYSVNQVLDYLGTIKVGLRAPGHSTSGQVLLQSNLCCSFKIAINSCLGLHISTRGHMNSVCLIILRTSFPPKQTFLFVSVVLLLADLVFFNLKKKIKKFHGEMTVYV